MVNEISVGSDPEFVIINGSGKVISAEELFGKCGECDPCEHCGMSRCNGDPNNCGVCEECEEDDCDNCNICYGCDSCDHDEPEDCDACGDCEEQDRLYEAEIGCDGNSTIGELRPCFEFSPEKHHANIANLISQIDIPSTYQIWAGTHVGSYNIGGHIHLGGEGLGSFEFAKYISGYAGTLLRKIEHPEDLRFRGLNPFGYGLFAGYNPTEYGIEWRMPASWLVSSDIALSALCLARVVANEYIVNPPTKIIKMPKIEEQIKTISSTYMTTRLIHNVERMDEYNKYSKELEPLFQLLINKEKWVTKVDIRSQW